LIKIPSLASS